jgi:sister-chromatid-cohesion protein PDS5
MPGMEDRLLVERLLNTCLVPFSLASAERMKKLFLLFSTIDDNASKSFIEMQKNQQQVRKCVAELVVLHKQPRTDAEALQKEIAVKIYATSKFLPDPVKATEFIRKLSQNLFADKALLSLMERITDPNVTCSDCMSNVVSTRHKDSLSRHFVVGAIVDINSKLELENITGTIFCFQEQSII